MEIPPGLAWQRRNFLAQVVEQSHSPFGPRRKFRSGPDRIFGGIGSAVTPDRGQNQ